MQKRISDAAASGSVSNRGNPRAPAVVAQQAINDKVDAMHDKAHASVKAQRNVTHAHGRGK